MDPKRAQLLLVILIFCQSITSGDGNDTITKREGEQVEIRCKTPESTATTIWFRTLDRSGMEFIGSFDINGKKKPTTHTPSSEFDYSKMNQNTLVLRSFKKEKDSGRYSCATYKNAELIFGPTTRLVGEKAPEPTVPAAAAATKALCTTAAPCVCKNGKRGESGLSLDCAPMILGPLAGGCGLLLLLLIITTLYCNKIRTRRCPHHYRRKPRAMPVGNK